MFRFVFLWSLITLLGTHLGAQSWSDAPPMLQARNSHTSTLLADDRVLVVGGFDDEISIQPSAEIFDPNTLTWESTQPTVQRRAGHTATLLLDGRVLVVGGGTFNQQTSEIFDPESGVWTASGDLNTERAGFTATRMSDGSVVVVGGFVRPDSSTASVERWDPLTGLWTPLSPLQHQREGHAAVLLQDGRLFVAGGSDREIANADSSLSSTELFDLAGNTWSDGGPLTEHRSGHSLVVLDNGDVMAVGGTRLEDRGEEGTFGFVRTTSEYYQTATDTWLPPQDLSEPLSSPRTVKLDDGNLLTVYRDRFAPAALASIYKTASSTWVPAPSLAPGRFIPRLTLLKDGRVLATGGGPGGGALGINRVEFFSPPDLLFYPQLALGGGFTCIVQVSNTSGETWTGKAVLNGGDWPQDQPWSLNGGQAAANSEFGIQLGAFETMEFRLTAQAGPFVGWFTLQATDGSRSADVSPSFFYNFAQDSTLVDSVGVSPAQAHSAFTFPVFRNASVNTGIAIRGSAGPLQLTLYDEDGSILSQLDEEIDGAAFIDQIFPGVPDEFLGLARIESASDFYLLVVRQELVGSGFQITTTPATPVP